VIASLEFAMSNNRPWHDCGLHCLSLSQYGKKNMSQDRSMRNLLPITSNCLIIWLRLLGVEESCQRRQVSEEVASVLRLVVVKPLRVNLAPLTTCAQVDKSERKLAKFAQVRVIFAGAP